VREYLGRGCLIQVGEKVSLLEVPPRFGARPAGAKRRLAAWFNPEGQQGILAAKRRKVLNCPGGFACASRRGVGALGDTPVRPERVDSWRPTSADRALGGGGLATKSVAPRLTASPGEFFTCGIGNLNEWNRREP